MRIELHAPEGLPRINAPTEIGDWVQDALRRSGFAVADGDVLVVAQKIVSKAEGRVVDLDSVVVGPTARTIAIDCGKDPALIEVILTESVEVVRQSGPHLIMQHRLGFVSANAAVDQSNAGGARRAILLPLDPDASAARIRAAILEATGARTAVIISDTHGRPFRNGAIGVAIGLSGMSAVHSWRGRRDLDGRVLETTEVAVADELASAASLLMGQSDEGRPIVVVRGFEFEPASGSARELIRPRERDLFR